MLFFSAGILNPLKGCFPHYLTLYGCQLSKHPPTHAHTQTYRVISDTFQVRPGWLKAGMKESSKCHLWPLQPLIKP